MEGAGLFDTVQYCIDNSVPCFTFRMDSSKRVCVKGGVILSLKKRQIYNINRKGLMEQKQEQDVKVVEDIKVPKNCKENRYYYRHREKILEKQRLARLAKKGVDITKCEIETPMEERRKKKMEFLGLLDDSKIVPCVSPGV